MKTFIKSISLLIILSVGLFSCKTASVMKRHYNKGYYVSKKHKPAETKTAERTASRKTTVTPDFKPSEELAKVSVPETGKDVVIKDEPVSKKTKKALIKESAQPISNAFNKLGNPASIIGMPKYLKEALQGDDVARDALSLLWILILILLIVYVVGLLLDLFGLGPIFHILGVIVLILLILWLLRVI